MKPTLDGSKSALSSASEVGVCDVRIATSGVKANLISSCVFLATLAARLTLYIHFGKGGISRELRSLPTKVDQLKLVLSFPALSVPGWKPVSCLGAGGVKLGLHRSTWGCGL